MLVRPLEGRNAVAVVELAKVDGSELWRVVTTGVR